MAKILDTDPVLYAKERDGFLRDLQHFHETRGTPFRRAPTINGHEIDLYLLYCLVTEEGGWIKVNSKNTWSKLFQQFKLPDKCINAGVGLKQLYLRYLDRWEKVHFLGEEADRGSEDDEESRHKRWSARALHSVPLSYNHQQHNIADSTREYNNFSTNLYKQSDFDRLVLSLLSPLPNEQDFAINVCTLLSNDSRHTLKLEKYPRIIEHLLAHTGVYNHSSLRKLFTNYYDKIRQHSLDSFWKDVIETREYLDLTNESEFVTSSSNITQLPNTNLESTSTAESIENSIIKTDTLVNTLIPSPPFTADGRESNSNQRTDDDSAGEFVQSDESTSDTEFFSLGRSLGTQDYIGQRILQVASILRNLSFIEENIPVLSNNQTFIRFMILCSSSRWMNLQSLGLDILGNISCEYMLKDFQTDKVSMALLRLITKGLESDDRAFCIASLDSLNKLSQKEANEEILARALDSCVFRRVCSFLTLQDVMVLVYTLECLYSLSSLGERPCNFIVNIHGVIDTLVSLVTVEGKSYGPKACIGMKLVETVPGVSSVTQSNSTASTSTTATVTSSITTAASPSSITTTVSSSTTPLTSASVIQSTPTKVVVSSTPTRNIQITPQRVIITPVSTTTSTSTSITTQVISPQQLVQQQHAHQQAIQENEQFALAWIRATYEPHNGGRVEQQELYKHYINSCAKIGRRGVIAPLHFPRCVRSVFGGTVGPNPLKGVSANDAQYYEGIKVRVQPLVISVQSMSNLSTTQSPVKGSVRRKSQNTTTGTAPSTTQVPTISLLADNTDTPPPSPASPILKAQLSAPSKSRENTVINSTVKGDIKSQVMAHPHLSQALLGSSGNSNNSGKESQTSQSNTSLIKTLLATKVNDCMSSSISMKSSMDCQSVVQVAARQQQQRLLAQQTPQSSKNVSQVKAEDKKASRINGACQFFGEDSSDTSIPTTVNSNFGTVKREPPQPPPPPLAPLSNLNRNVLHRMENDDSDSTGNNSLASSSGINIGISSTEDGDNSLTSFEGLLNGVPNIDNPLNLNDDSNSKDSLVISRNKPLMLADLLEKKVEKDPPILNGLLAKELRIGDKGLELVENHIDKVLNKESANDRVALAAAKNVEELSGKHGIKRPADNEDDDEVVNTKKTRFLNNEIGVNGSLNADSPVPDSVSSSSNGDEATATVSTAAAKLFADFAADILEDEEEEFMQDAQPQPTSEDSGVVQVIQNNNVQSVFVDQPQSQVIVTAQPRQIIVSQPTNQMVLPAGAQLKAGQTVIVQNTPQQRPQMVLQQANTGQFLLSPSIQGQMQLVASTTQPGQYVLQTGATQGAYVVAQSQTAMVHGQPQTVLVAQTTQQQGSPAKTIIILQQPNTSATHHPKVVVTPQGQQVVVTQVQRPLLQTASTTSNIVPTPTSTVIKTTGSAITQTVAPTTCTVVEKKVDEVKPIVKPKILRDISTPFVCEWGDCQIDTKFKSANQVYLHVCAAHCPETEEELTCQWDRCDNMNRKRFSLMTHIFDKHCNLEVMKQSQLKRKHQSQTGKTEPPSPSPVVPHPGYAPDAALHAIKRHALEFVNPKELQQGTAKQGTVTASPSVPRSGPTSTEQDDNEGPVTKSMRLTAALILRNLVIYSNNCKRYLRHYEPHLANVALSNVESSRTVAQILYDMSDSVIRR